jgi:hypothetical protein
MTRTFGTRVNIEENSLKQKIAVKFSMKWSECGY